MKRLLAITAVLILAGCAGTADTEVTPSPTDVAAPPVTITESPVDVADSDAPDDAPVPAAQLTFQSVDVMSGETINGVDYAGQNVVFWFWAPWCPTCQFESVNIRSVLAELPDDVLLVGVAGLDVAEAFVGFVEEYDLHDMRHIEDPDAEIWASFGIAATSSYAFVTADGDVDVVQGSIPSAELTSRIQDLSSQ